MFNNSPCQNSTSPLSIGVHLGSFWYHLDSFLVSMGFSELFRYMCTTAVQCGITGVSSNLRQSSFVRKTQRSMDSMQRLLLQLGHYSSME